MLTNGRTVNMSNHRLIGAEFQLIHRFWLDKLKNTLGFIDILQNTKMDQCMHGNRVQHLGVLKDRHVYATGNMQNLQKVRDSMERLTERNPLWIDDELWERACEPDCEEIDAVYRKLKDYEDAKEQGLLLRLPCKVGDIVYKVNIKSTSRAR